MSERVTRRKIHFEMFRDRVACGRKRTAELLTYYVAAPTCIACRRALRKRRAPAPDRKEETR